MKHLPTYLLYVAGWVCITIVYIFSTQLEDASCFNITNVHKNHQITQGPVAAKPDNGTYVLLLKKHRQLHPYAKSKVSPKEVSGKIIVLPVRCEDNIGLSIAADTKNTSYSNYLKNQYKCRFFKEINPRPPQNC